MGWLASCCTESMLTHALPPLQVELAFIVASAGECLGPSGELRWEKVPSIQVLTNKHALCQSSWLRSCLKDTRRVIYIIPFVMVDR